MDGYYLNGKLNYIHRSASRPPHNETALHCHDMCELLYFEKGDGELVLEGKRQLLFPGALVILPRGTMHFINVLSDKPYVRSVINFEGGSFEKAQVLDISGQARIISVFERMREYAGLFSGEQRDEILSACLTELILLIKSSQKQVSQEYGKLIHQATTYIERHLQEIENVSALCEVLHISRAQLYREFERELSKSPMRYINDLRLERAKNLLKLGEDATRVCERCGFRDYSAFYRAYKKYFGHSPSKIC
ncbi:MAG: helix-turn-helix transcriptional regulator [Clostridia bacterium]|nr:helix-turn-helix transcriptional regulator [Clostridia bacterium]